MIGAVIGENLGLSQVILLKKYLNFSNLFDKTQADILLPHNQHNLAIELKTDKQLSFGLIYDFSIFELDMLCKYINEMLAKRFITSSKSFLGTFILFTNKKNRGLHLCINYRNLNAITKKNKHSLLLMRILLDCFIGIKHYTKLNIIVAYNALHLQAGTKWKPVFRYCYKHFEY